MDRDQIVSTLRSKASDLRQLGAARLFLFGSAARDELGPGSDVDLFLEFEDPTFSLIELLKLQGCIAEILNMPIDLMTRGGIHPRLRSGIESSALEIF